MTPAGAVTLIGVGLTVLVLAAYLIRIALILTSVTKMLNTVIAAIQQVAEIGAPLHQVIGDINKEITDGQMALEAVVARHTGRRAVAPKS